MGTFELQGVVHLVYPTGVRARHLEDLRQGIAAASLESLFYHAHQFILRFPDADELPPNDFAAWVGGVVQDQETAERLAFASLSEGSDLEALRKALLAVLDSLPEKDRLSRDAPEGGEFCFHGSQSVRVPGGVGVATPEELVEALRTAEPACLFLHLVERPVLEPEAPDRLERWVESQGDARLAEILRDSLHWGLPLEDTRRQVVRRWSRSRLGRRLAARTQAPAERRDREAQQAVAGFVRRVRGTGETEESR